MGTSVLKNHLEKVQNSGFFYFKGRGKLRGSRSGVTEDTDISKGPRGMVKLRTLVAKVSVRRLL